MINLEDIIQFSVFECTVSFNGNRKPITYNVVAPNAKNAKKIVRGIISNQLKDRQTIEKFNVKCINNNLRKIIMHKNLIEWLYNNKVSNQTELL